MEPTRKANGSSSGDSYAELRSLLVGPERDRIEHLQRRVDDPTRRAEDIAAVLPSAIRLRSGRDGALRFALHPLVEQSLHLSFQRNPRFYADALFPVLGVVLRRGASAALDHFTQSLNQIVERYLSFRSLHWRWQAFRQHRPFTAILVERSRLYRVQQIFLIHKQSGTLLQQRVADTMVIRDPGLVTAILSPIQDFARDSFGGRPPSDLEKLRLGDFTVWIQHGPRAILAAVLSGIPPKDLGAVLERTLEKIGSEKGYELDHFDGDTSPFLACQEELKGCFLGQAPPRGKPSMALWWLLAALLVLALVFGSYYGVAENAKWESFLSRLRSQPGLVVVSTEKSGRLHRVFGLRDPMAPDPAKLLAGTGLDPSQVTFHWEPYHSLQPRFESLRRLAADRQALEAETLRFLPDGLRLAPDQTAALDRIARLVNSIVEISGSVGKRVRVEIQAFPDDDRQAAARAAAAKAALVIAGAPPEVLAPNEMPVAPAQMGRDAAGNRLVTFRLLASPD